jgi:kynureninase
MSELDPLLEHRGQFPILDSTIYLISNSLGAVPRAASDSLQEYYETWASRGVRAWEEGWWTLASELGNLIAPLIGAGSDEVVFQPNVTIAHAVLFSAFEFTRRPKILTDAMHFPSILYLIDQLRSSGAEIVVIPSHDGVSVDSQQVADAIDDRTALVSLSHVLFKSSYIHDLAPIVERAKQAGAKTIIDGYQSVGTIPVDVVALDVDAYIGGCLKWLCGGPGAAFLWVRPEIRCDLNPKLAGWMSHQRPFAFEPTLDRRADAWRFLHGTPNIPALYAARPGLELIQAAGIAEIRAKSIRQTARLIEHSLERGWRINAPLDPKRRAGTVAIDVAHGLEVSRTLKSRQILCDYRPGAGIRLSPHFYNRDDECDFAVDAIEEILQTEAWTRIELKTSVVT